MKLSYFRDISFLQAIKALFNELNVPVNYVADEPTSAQEILKDTYKENSTFQLVNEVYFVGMVDDAAFEGNKSLAVEKIKSDYDGILIFGVTLNQRENNLLPTRSQLAEISRAFNREFYYTPVVLVFKYADDKGQYIAFANTERLQYKQAWREGEKAGKVSLLRDIDIQRPHRGHEDIINQLRIQTSGTKAVDTFAKLYAYWQEVFSVSVLNKRFYQELSNWYFWAVKQVTFPGKPTEADAIKKNAKLDDLIQEHNATNVIRLLTRLLFTWFIKEKKLIPEELFDLEALQKDILNNITPYHENGLFNQANKDSVYYRAVLQNLFFASLNCPIKPDGTDSRERGFRGDGYGTHRGIDYLMRYKRYFKNPDSFLVLMNKTVPFLNGGLFECLDDKYSNTYIDGFSDQMTKGEQLIVPDYLFFGTPEEVDLSTEYGVNNNTTKKAAVKGLINILKSYKFTITENTPIEEDVALDPELLGKVFENLLASYNPETKTTARKQTGSFYTPREIVNYMVDESLIAYLKNAVTDWGMDEKQVDEKLHQLASFDAKNPFSENQKLTRDIVSALDRCKILDPACGSGAFPMGVLQKMVHMLQKLDPNNLIWKEVQIQKVQEETSEVFKTIDDKAEREEKLKEINNAFDQRVNDPDYARKLYLIENCIYGVDIQPIATQISKLRFFISLVVDQKSNSKAYENFGIRPLPNLETKFVTANTLIGINKEANLFTTDKVKDLEKQLKNIRHKLFSARTKDTKLKYRQKDEELRKTIAEELKKQGLPIDSAEKLAKWDPYDQNASSPFFDSEWMFDIAEGFDVVIGNPPFVFTRDVDFDGNFKKYVEDEYFSKMTRGKKSKSNQSGKINLFAVFIIKGLFVSNKNGYVTFIVPNNILRTTTYDIVRRYILENSHVEQIVDLGSGVFDNVTASTIVLGLSNRKTINETKVITNLNNIEKYDFETKTFDQSQFLENVSLF
ncbi:N-6 DNA Methylase [anaerobic digester metagenome]